MNQSLEGDVLCIYMTVFSVAVTFQNDESMNIVVSGKGSNFCVVSPEPIQFQLLATGSSSVCQSKESCIHFVSHVDISVLIKSPLSLENYRN